MPIDKVTKQILFNHGKGNATPAQIKGALRGDGLRLLLDTSDGRSQAEAIISQLEAEAGWRTVTIPG